MTPRSGHGELPPNAAEPTASEGPMQTKSLKFPEFLKIRGLSLGRASDMFRPRVQAKSTGHLRTCSIFVDISFELLMGAGANEPVWARPKCLFPDARRFRAGRGAARAVSERLELGDSS